MADRKKTNMKATGIFKADVVQEVTKRNNAHDGRTTFVDLDIGVKRSEAEKFSDGFFTLAFSTMTLQPAKGEDDEAIVFLMDKIKPGRRVVWEVHSFNIEGVTIEAQPQLVSIATVDGEERVIVRLRIPITSQHAQLITWLREQVGKVITIEMNPSQASFEFKRRGEKKATTEEAPAIQ